jgi:predicted Zn-dependent peptidase
LPLVAENGIFLHLITHSASIKRDRASTDMKTHAQKLPDSHYEKTILSNGIRIVTEEIPHVRSVTIGAWVTVGSRDESESNNGITHFVEHMVFKGTRRYKAHQIAQSLESVGGYLNAFTTKENTCFYARILDHHLPKAIDVLSDLVFHPTFDRKEMEKEKGVVIEEIKNIEDNPDDLIHDYFENAVFRKHPLGMPIIGTRRNIANFTREDLHRYHAQYYAPHRLVIAAAGNLKHEKVVTMVEKYFRSRSNENGQFQRAQGPKSVHSNKVEVYEKPITQAHVCLGTVGYSVKSRFRYPVLVLNSLLGEGMSSRLFQTIREKHGYAYTVFSFTNFLSDTGNFGVYIGTDASKVDHAIELVFKEFQNVKTKRVSTAELKRTKEQLKGSMMLGLESMSSRMMRLGSGEINFGKYTPIDEILHEIDAVGADEVNSVANRLLDENKFSTIIFKPAKAEKTSAAEQ